MTKRRWTAIDDPTQELIDMGVLSPARCVPCNEFFLKFRCNSPEECDCPPCQGMCECEKCETCQGKGQVIDTNQWTLDRGTKWQRNCEEKVNIECPDCNGQG